MLALSRNVNRHDMRTPAPLPLQPQRQRLTESQWEPTSQVCAKVAAQPDANERYYMTLAFAFSAKTKAAIHLERKERDDCRNDMKFAIEMPEKGDGKCRTRAAMLSELLSSWLKEWKMKDEAPQESERAIRIQGEIDGES
ncbi:MAG: hypothetical protein M1834_007627 [Cirrosporium novae-zelandiae]|nr:MAG: hypothetical protein M1834_007627 [Cirrosporium novae-zelandiae]